MNLELGLLSDNQINNLEKPAVVSTPSFQNKIVGGNYGGKFVQIVCE